MPGEFIDIRVDAKVAKNTTLAAKLAEICPVSIFVSPDSPDAGSGEGIVIDESNLDECVLCDLCLQAAPKGKIKIIKLYE